MDITLPYKWIQEYLKTDLNAIEFAKTVTLVGVLMEKWHFNEKLDDYLLESEVTANRVDLASVIGVAREAAATLKTDFLYNPYIIPTENISSPKPIKISIDAKDACRRYQGIVIENITVSESPKWLKDRLEALGMNSINNLVDISNYVLVEYGQPTHIFDYDKVSGSEIIVRFAKNGEKLVTLDNQEKELTEADLVIADQSRVLGLAGVKGGLDSGVSSATKTIIIEAANFEPYTIRKQARRHLLQTDAASLFEKNLLTELTSEALARVVQLVLELAGGNIASEIIDVRSQEAQTKVIDLNPNLFEKIIGISLSNNEIIDILSRLEFKVEEFGSILKVTVPYFRINDILEDFDIVEEIARVYGYHNIPGKIPDTQIPQEESDCLIELEDKVRITLSNFGFTETFSRSQISDKHIQISDVKPEQTIQIYNPLTEDFKYMRTELASSLILIASQNQKFEEELQLFELNQVFIPKSESELPTEKSNLTLLISGKDSKSTFFDLKGTFERLVKSFGIDSNKLEFVPTQNHPVLENGAAAQIFLNGVSLGFIGIISTEAKKIADLDTQASILEIDFELLAKEIKNSKKTFTEIPKFQAVERDIAILIDKNILWGDIKKSIDSLNSELIKQIELFDVYEGKGIEEGKKSVAFRITLRSDEKTLEEGEISKVVDSITQKLVEGFGVEVR